MSESFNHHAFRELRMLVLQSLDGTITRDELARMEALLKSDSRVRAYYRHCISLYCDLEGVLSSQEEALQLKEKNNLVLNAQFWKTMAEEEKKAPAISIEESVSEKVPVKMVKVEKSPRVINKLSLYSAIVSIAALVFVLVFVRFAPPPASSVAMITDSLNAQWLQNENPTGIGDRLWNNDGPLLLRKGTVKIEFDYGAEVIIEGPAEFKLETADKMALHSGRIYTTVPTRATGFTIQTPSSTVIDLGTEFGVQVNFDGSTNVHMFKGKASLIPGADGKKEASLELLAGDAKGVTLSGQVREIDFQEGAFIYSFDSGTGLVRRRIPIPYEFEVFKSQPATYWRVNPATPDRFCSVLGAETDIGKQIPGLTFVPGPPLGNGKTGMAVQIDPNQPNCPLISINDIGDEGYSYMLWIKPKSIRHQVLFISTNQELMQREELSYRGVAMNEKGQLRHFTGSFHNKITSGFSGKSLAENQWYHVAVTYEKWSRTRNIYLNGKLTSSQSVNNLGLKSGIMSLHDQYCFGFPESLHVENAPPMFDGAIGEFCIYDRTLDADEIQKLYEASQNEE